MASNIDLHNKYWCSMAVIKCPLGCKNTFKRFVIEGSEERRDNIVTLDAVRMKEGEMFGADIPLAILEQKAEERDQKLILKVIIETVNFKLNGSVTSLK
ncbi:hypothetical protein AC249_AIPGENE21518 [Exaiptasia diaphana]|nr:hypothetical protein AC249_AIPGENE21518 [Exaiptasia diaphana]